MKLLVLYSQEFASRPLETLRRLEAFLGVAHDMFDERRAALWWNTRDCYVSMPQLCSGLARSLHVLCWPCSGRGMAAAERA
jgi:hypothetical protein